MAALEPFPEEPELGVRRRGRDAAEVESGCERLPLDVAGPGAPASPRLGREASAHRFRRLGRRRGSEAAVVVRAGHGGS
jgi:hypothetical protein